jgi:hypothetical protein
LERFFHGFFIFDMSVDFLVHKFIADKKVRSPSSFSQNFLHYYTGDWLFTYSDGSSPSTPKIQTTSDNPMSVDLS